MSVEPIHGPMCSQINGVCVGFHCAWCGEPCSSQGHFGCPRKPGQVHVEAGDVCSNCGHGFDERCRWCEKPFGCGSCSVACGSCDERVIPE